MVKRVKEFIVYWLIHILAAASVYLSLIYCLKVYIEIRYIFRTLFVC